MSDDEHHARVRQLILSGDNMIKNRDNPERYARARDRFARAREIVVTHDLGDQLLTIIDRRLEGLQSVDGADSPSQ